MSIILPIYNKGVKTECGNCTGISVWPITYKILFYILLSRLTPYTEKIVRDYYVYGFRRFRSTIDHIFCTRQILEKKWQYNEAVHMLFIDFVKAYDSVRREVMYNILIRSGITKKLVRLTKMRWRKPISESREARICLTCFLLGMV